MLIIRTILAASLLVLLVHSLPAFAPTACTAAETGEDGARKYRLRGFFLYSLTMGESNAEGRVVAEVDFIATIPSIPPILFGASADLDFEGAGKSQSGMGGAASIEYLLIDERIGIEAGGLYVKDMVEYEFISRFEDPVPNPPIPIPDVVETGTLDGYMVALAVNFHTKPTANLDLYAGPVFAPKIDITGSDAMEVGRNVAYGVNIGADWFKGDSMMLSAKLSYIDFGQVEINERYYLGDDGEVNVAGMDVNVGGYFYSNFEAGDDLRFLAVMVGAGLAF